LILLFWFFAFFLFLRFFVWRRGPWSYAQRTPDVRAILAERYARGEITHEEYRERLGHLVQAGIALYGSSGAGTGGSPSLSAESCSCDRPSRCPRRSHKANGVGPL
jgi:hypothetical protein